MTYISENRKKYRFKMHDKFTYVVDLQNIKKIIANNDFYIKENKILIETNILFSKNGVIK